MLLKCFVYVYAANGQGQSVWFPSSTDGIICTFHDDRRPGGQGWQDADQSSEDEDRPAKVEEGREVEAHGGGRVSSDRLLSLCSSVIFVNENENGEKRENNEFVNEN